MWYGKVTAYAFWSLKGFKNNYSTHDLELTVVIFVLKMWKHFFFGYGVHCDIYTDHKTLRYTFTQ